MLALWIFTGIIVFLFCSFWGIIIYGMVESKQATEAYAAIEQSDLTDVDPSQMDYASVSGEITDTDGFLTAPLTEKECVAYRVEIQRWQLEEGPRGRPEPGGKKWIADAAICQSSRFLLEDEFSSVAVDGSDEIVEGERTHKYVSESGVKPPEKYASVFDLVDVYFFDDEGVSKGHKLRFVEERVDLRDTVHVAGGIEQAPAEFSSANAIINKELEKDGVSHPFIISKNELDGDKIDSVVGSKRNIKYLTPDE